DSSGRPGIGSLVWVSAMPPADPTGTDERWERGIAWGGQIERADGSIDVPHAQLWRALEDPGFDVRIAGFTLWDDAMVENRSLTLPEDPHEELRFEVAP